MNKLPLMVGFTLLAGCAGDTHLGPVEPSPAPKVTADRPVIYVDGRQVEPAVFPPEIYVDGQRVAPLLPTIRGAAPAGNGDEPLIYIDGVLFTPSSGRDQLQIGGDGANSDSPRIYVDGRLVSP